jgi:cytochrome c556
MRGTLISLTLSAISWSAIALVEAQGLPPAEAIKNRIANFREMGTAFKGIRDELRGSDPYLPSIQDSAGQIESLGTEIPTWFAPGTGPVAEPEKGFIDTILGWFSSQDDSHKEGKTKAKAAVWTQRAAFEQAHRRFHAAARRMNEVAQSGDKAAVAAQFKALGETCKNCHDTFREKVDDDD